VVIPLIGCTIYELFWGSPGGWFRVFFWIFLGLRGQQFLGGIAPSEIVLRAFFLDQAPPLVSKGYNAPLFICWILPLKNESTTVRFLFKPRRSSGAIYQGKRSTWWVLFTRIEYKFCKNLSHVSQKKNTTSDKGAHTTRAENNSPRVRVFETQYWYTMTSAGKV